MTVAEARAQGILPPKHDDGGGEQAMQGDVEMMLARRGYRRLTANNAASVSNAQGWSIKGWFGHWTENRRNPLMPDIAVFSPDMRRCLMLELKSVKRYQPGQREMIEAGAWVECNTVEDAELRVMEWEAEIYDYEN